MLRYLLITLLINPSLSALAQAPHIQWQKCYGGSGDDFAEYVIQTADSGYAIAGYSYSSDHDVTVNHGMSDVWIVKTDKLGAIMWQRSYGGSNDDRANYIQQTADGGYIVGGVSRSSDGDVTSNYGNYDWWVIKLDALGNITWQKNFGGSGYDLIHCMRQTRDGNYILAGSTASNDHDVTGNHGVDDYWIIKLSSTGGIIWQQVLGGSGSDLAGGIWENRDSSFYVVGNVASNDGDVSGNHGSDDIWILKLSSSGSLLWEKCYGGTSLDDVIDDPASASIQQTFDNGIIFTGWSWSTDGDVTGNHGVFDYWVVKLDDTGRIEWEQSYGGTSWDFPASVVQTSDSGYLVTGTSLSNDGDVSGSHGNYDYWTIKLSPAGALLWQKCDGGDGGSYGEMTGNAIQTLDLGYIIGGATNSNDSEVTGNHGGYDYWLVKLLAETTLNTPAVPEQSISVIPNPATDKLTITGGTEPTSIVVYNLAGQNVTQATNTREVAISGLAPGMYFVSIYANDMLLKREKIVKQ